MSIIEKLSDLVQEAMHEVRFLEIKLGDIKNEIGLNEKKKEKILAEVKECETTFEGVSLKVLKEKEQVIKNLEEKEQRLSKLEAQLDQRGLELQKKFSELKNLETDSKLRLNEAMNLKLEAEKIKADYTIKMDKLHAVAAE